MNTPKSEDTQATRERPGNVLPVPPDALREPLPAPVQAEETAAEKEQPVTVLGSTEGDSESRERFTESVHQYIREYIRLADQKATFFFAGATALLAFLYKNGMSARWLKPILTWNVLDTVAFVAMSALAIGACLSLLVVIPRTKGSRRGFLFWEAIAEYASGRTYADELWRLSSATLFRVRAEHCFDLARVCRAKYKVLRRALWSCAIGLVASLLVFLFA